MGKQLTTSFTAYELTARETLESSIYTGLQQQVLHNHLSTYAEKKLALKYDPNDREVYLQQEAELTAQIELIQYLLVASETAQEQLTNKPAGEL